MKALYVDLDGTLLKSDSLHELFGRLLLTKFFRALFSIFILCIKGRAPFKAYLANKVLSANIVWPLDQELLTFLREEKVRGRKIVLLTAANEQVANSIVSPLAIFDEIIGSTQAKNFKGREKLKWIKEHDSGEFAYIGNGSDDLVLWEEADQAIVVNANNGIIAKAKRVNKNLLILSKRKKFLKIFLKAIRIHQYSKNALVFLPLLLSAQIFNLQLLSKSTLAFIAFCLVASSGYLINDLKDLDADRLHASKNKRPMAAGDLPILLHLWYFLV